MVATLITFIGTSQNVVLYPQFSTVYINMFSAEKMKQTNKVPGLFLTGFSKQKIWLLKW